jgi:glycosyltransferase involved in cell wall biosynthesis
MDNTNPLVSIISPSLNQARFVRDAIESVAHQIYRPIEHIVMDGGSTDGTIDVLADRARAYGHVHWQSESDHGQSNAVNKGIGRSGGQVIGWLNADDFYCPDAIGRAVDALTSEPDVLAVYGHAWQTDEDGRPRRLFPATREHVPTCLRRELNYIAQPTVFIQRDALEQVGALSESLQWSMDWDLWIRLSERGRMRMLPIPLASMREHARTKTSVGGLARYREIVRMLRSHGVAWSAPAYRLYLASVVIDTVRWFVPRFSQRRSRMTDRQLRAAQSVYRWWERAV